MVRIAFAGPSGSGKTTAAAMASAVVIDQGHPSRGVLSFATPLKVAVDTLGIEGAGMRRRLYQAVGGAVRAESVNHFVRILLGAVEALGSNVSVFVDDVRYGNEAAALQAVGFTVVYMRRQKGPWSLTGVAGAHISEHSFGDIEEDMTLCNDGSLDDLRRQVRDLVLRLLESEAAEHQLHTNNG